MKRLSLVLIGVGCLLFQAQATLLFSDGFGYNTGFLAGNINPGSGDKWGPSATPITVASGSLAYSGLVDLPGDNKLSDAWGTASSITNGFASTTSGTIYYSFLLDVTTAPGANSYLTSLNPGTTPPGGSGDAITMYFGTVTGGTTFKLGVRGGGSSTVNTPSTYSVGTTYLIVLGYDFGAADHNMSLWVNPTPGGSMPSATVTQTPGTKATSIANVGFKAQGTTGTFLIDDLRIGTTWGDVTPTPEPSTFALAGLGMLGLILARRVRR